MGGTMLVPCCVLCLLVDWSKYIITQKKRMCVCECAYVNANSCGISHKTLQYFWFLLYGFLVMGRINMTNSNTTWNGEALKASAGRY